MNRDTALAATAWLSARLHVLGLVAALLMRPGTPAFSIAERSAFVAARPAAWIGGWIAWMLCALALIAFLAALARQVPDSSSHAWLARLAVVVAAAGAAVDLLCDTLYITVLPDLAAQGAPAEMLFLALERGLGATGLIVANGLYSLAVLSATLALRSQCATGTEAGPTVARRDVPRHVLGLGYATFFFGMLMVAAGFTGVPWHLEFAAGPTIGCLVLWTLAAARAVNQHPRVGDTPPTPPCQGGENLTPPIPPCQGGENANAEVRRESSE